MRKRFFALLLAAAVVFACVPAALAADDSLDGKTVLLWTANVEGDLSVYPEIAAAKADYEARGAEVLLLDAGNFTSGRAAANASFGAAVYELMDAAGYDAAAMGVREFANTEATVGYLYHGNFTKYYTQAELQNGCDELTYGQNRDGSVTAVRAAREAAKFAAVSTNATALNETVYSFEKSVVLERGGHTFEVFGVTDEAVAESVQDGFVAVGECEIASEADVVVVLSNAGETAAPEGAIVVGAASGAGFAVGAYIIDNETLAVESAEVSLDGEDEAIAARVAEIEADAPEALAVSEVTLVGADSANWNGETNLGDLTADALLWAAQFIDGIGDYPTVAIQNGGNCDQFIYAGELTETDLLRALPFSPMGIGAIELSGAELLETLEAAAQSSDCPGFAQVAGMSYTIDRTAEYDAGEAYGKYFKADSINRVSITEINGEDFDPEATYIVVCDNFLINGNDTYYTLSDAKERGANYINNGNGFKTRDAVALYVESELGGVIGERYAEPQGRIKQINFRDVAPTSYAFEAVDWAVENGITNGTDEFVFSPARDCSTAEILTFIHRAAGCPEPETEVEAVMYYDKAVAWAIEQGIADEKVELGAPCTRLTAVEYLHRAAGSPEAEVEADFGDVSSAAVDWALERGITTGTDEGVFSPDEVCDRAQIVTFLWRQLGK